MDRQSTCLGPRALNAFRAQLRRTTELVIAIRRAMGQEGAELRAEVLDDLKGALADAVPTLEMIAVEGEPEPQPCISIEDLFRSVFAASRVDCADEFVQETFWEAARQVVEDALSRQPD